jgi:hypothetical protein
MHSMAFDCRFVASLLFLVLAATGPASSQNAPEQVHLSMGGKLFAFPAYAHVA